MLNDAIENMAGHAVSGRRDCTLGLVHGRKDQANVPDQHLADAREPESAPVLLEERRSRLHLQDPQLL